MGARTVVLRGGPLNGVRVTTASSLLLLTTEEHGLREVLDEHEGAPRTRLMPLVGAVLYADSETTDGEGNAIFETLEPVEEPEPM